jgi:hypothetical protein
MKSGFSGGVLIGVVLGAALSIMADEEFRLDRSVRHMSRVGRKLGRCCGRAYTSMRHMI